jgi:hypothetical protein
MSTYNLKSTNKIKCRINCESYKKEKKLVKQNRDREKAEDFFKIKKISYFFFLNFFLGKIVNK